MKKVIDLIRKHWKAICVVAAPLLLVFTFLSFGGCWAKEKQPTKAMTFPNVNSNNVRTLEVFESSLSHGRVVIVCGTNVMDHPFITSHDAFQWVVGTAKRLPINQSIRLIAKGDTLDVDKMFENVGDLIAFVASWRDVLPRVKTSLPVATNRAAITQNEDTAYVEAEIRRLRQNEREGSRRGMIAGRSIIQKEAGLPPFSRPSGLGQVQHEGRVVLSQGQAVQPHGFDSLQPPVFAQPPEKKTGFGRWWQRVSSGPSYTVVTYAPRTVSWRYRQAYSPPMYAGVGLFEPTPVMIGRSW